MKTRSGKSLRRDIYFWQPSDSQGNQALVDTVGYTARVQLRANQMPRRVIMSSTEYNTNTTPPVGTVLYRIEPGHWRLFLGKSITRSLPPRVTLEMELENDANPEDTTSLFEASLLVEPEAVVNG
jgi:hypothetical protein